MNTGQNKTQTFYMVIRVPKEESAFTYFQLEANEGLCFYSTLESSLKMGHRDLELQGSMEFKEDLQNLIKSLQKKYPIEILEDKILPIT